MCTAPKGSNSAKHPQKLKDSHTKTLQTCETSSIFDNDNVKNAAILWDYLQKWKSECWCDSLVLMRFAIFPSHVSTPATKKWGQVIRSAAPVTQNHLSKPEDLTLQNVTPLRKSAPWPPNIFDKDVSCTASATRNAFLQILFKCVPCLPSFLKLLINPHVLLTFGQVQNPLRLPHKMTIERPKVVSECGVLFTCWLRNVLRAAAACTFSTSQLPKVVQHWGVFTIFTSKYASCHYSIHFFNISTSKTAPKLKRFVHFDFEVFFAPRRRALFHQLNFQKCSGTAVFHILTFNSRHIRVLFNVSTSKSAPKLKCFVHFDVDMWLRAAPHPPL